MVRLRAGRTVAAVAAVVALLGGAALAATARPTSAAWTDSAVFSAAASSGTWAMPSAIACQVVDGNGDPAQGSCVATKVSGTEWGYPTTDYFQRTIQVTTTSATPVRWRVTIRFTDASLFPFVPTKVWDQQGGDTVVVPGASSCSPTPTVVLEGNPGHGRQTVVAGGPVSFQIGGTRGSAGLSGALFLACV